MSSNSPSIRLLFSFIPKRALFFLLPPAFVSSIVAGSVAPFMTLVVGQAFDAFANFPLTPNPPQSSKDALLHSIGISAIELIGLAFGALALSSITSCLWIWTGETNVMGLRKALYQAMADKDMAWFDAHLGSADSQADDKGSFGAGGLMARFSRETDQVRMASSLASGRLIQYITTCITCLVLALLRSWALTLVILSAIPLLIIIQGFSQAFASPLYAEERKQIGVAATIVERAVASIATVKAFNAQILEHKRATESFVFLKNIAKKLNTVWAFTSGISQFVTMAMFVQGFWFGARLVREGRISPGNVMAVFWACLIASSNLQMCLPQFIILFRGKLAMTALLSFVDPQQNPSNSNSNPTSFSSLEKGVLSSKKLIPTKCSGSFVLYNVTFAYPSRPSIPILRDVSIFLPANDTTFIVGSSGSGKSTLAHLLLKMYTPQSGLITFDESDITRLDNKWFRQHVACVGQQGAAGVVILDEKSVFENVAAAVLELEEDGEWQARPSEREVEEACRSALMHEFVRDLPMGYDTLLGGGIGVGLSGGQKQRLSIARARLRNPTVLILDEATSALDATSRVLVFEALKRWRKNKTTIVITHDLSQIGLKDFVYVLKEGRVVEQGYRSDLEDVVVSAGGDKGEFRKMMLSQSETGGFVPREDVPMALSAKSSYAQLREEFAAAADMGEDDDATTLATSSSLYRKHHSLGLRPLTFGTWMFEVVGDLTGSVRNLPTIMESPKHQSFRATPLFYDDKYTHIPDRQRRPSTTYDLPSKHEPLRIQIPTSPTAAHTLPARRYSLPPPTPTSATFTNSRMMTGFDHEEYYMYTEFERKNSMEMSADTARQARVVKEGTVRTRWDGSRDAVASFIKVEKLGTEEHDVSFEGERVEVNVIDSQPSATPGLFKLLPSIFSSISRAQTFFLFFGLFICLLNGAITPIFSFLLSRLLFEVSSGAQDLSVINRFGVLVLGIAALDGLFLGLKYFSMEISAMHWLTTLRSTALSRILAQDKSWFDLPSHSPSKLMQSVVNDAEDARNLVGVVLGQMCVVAAMLGIGLVWAVVRGWQLTLAGLAIAPVFAGAMALQSRLVAGCESRNRGAREEVASRYYDTIINIRGIRSMGLDAVFKSRFIASLEESLSTGVRGAFVEGCTYGLSSGLIYLAEALLFYIGAVLVSQGRYSYLQMVEVLNLVVFTVSIGSQLMAFTQKISKSSQATAELKKLATLDTNETSESQGGLKPDLSGTIKFHNVNFSYPGDRARTLVLKNLNFTINKGECVAIVGTSGCGKSTIISLLQRLYEPSGGSITVDGLGVQHIQVNHLREHLAVVNQQPHLFAESVAENIRYGRSGMTDAEVRIAAKRANVHEFVVGLPEGYNTVVGENASLVSGGQAQRLQIARALARVAGGGGARILVLDEWTAALDGENQAKVLEMLMESGRKRRTTVMITHSVDVMKMCDRILVVRDGKVVEQGRYEALVDLKGGFFASLARGGEWVGARH